MSKVFSVNDFKAGLDLRKTPLTAPGGSLRILENAVINQGGEIEKRLAFVAVATLPPEVLFVFGQGGVLHVFAEDVLVNVNPGTCPVPIVPHVLSFPYSETLARVIDVEAFNQGFYVTAQGTSGLTFTFWNGALVSEPGGTWSRGTYSRTYKNKVYRADGRYLRFSGVGRPDINDPADGTYPGAGFINAATNDPDGENIEAMEVYYDRMAVIARLMTQMWSLDPDPDKDTLGQVLRIGTIAPHSVLQFGTGDILFLSDSGVRSLRALSSTYTAAAVSDVGSAIDPVLIERIRTDPAGVRDAQAVVQPIRGRYWLAIRDTVYVLSYFPAGNITAWSTFMPGFTVQEFAVATNMVFCRGDGNVLYLYGGPSQTEQDACKVTVRTPHHAAEGPTTRKRIQSVDLMCQGTWSISIGMLPNNTEAFELVANVTNNTYGIESIPFAGYGTHAGIHMVNQAPGPATLAAVHLNLQEGSTK